MQGRVVVACILSAACQPATAGGEGVADVVNVIVYGGQSNASGAFDGSVPGGIPDADARLWNHTSFFNAEEIDFGEFRDLDCRDAPAGQHHGGELTLGLAFRAAAQRIAIVKIASGATTMQNWTLSGSHGPTFQSDLAAACAALPGEFPTHGFRFFLVWTQGENDSANDTNATLWSTRFATFYGQINDTLAEAEMGPIFGGAIVRTSIYWASGSEPALTHLREGQASAATAHGLALIDQDDFNNDGHISAPQQNTLGERQAAELLSQLP